MKLLIVHVRCLQVPQGRFGRPESSSTALIELSLNKTKTLARRGACKTSDCRVDFTKTHKANTYLQAHMCTCTGTQIATHTHTLHACHAPHAMNTNVTYKTCTPHSAIYSLHDIHACIGTYTPTYIPPFLPTYVNVPINIPTCLLCTCLHAFIYTFPCIHAVMHDIYVICTLHTRTHILYIAYFAYFTCMTDTASSAHPKHHSKHTPYTYTPWRIPNNTPYI